MGRPTAGCGEQAGSSWEVGLSPDVHQCVLYPGGWVAAFMILCHVSFWALDHVSSLLTSHWKQHLIEDGEPVF